MRWTIPMAAAPAVLPAAWAGCDGGGATSTARSTERPRTQPIQATTAAPGDADAPPAWVRPCLVVITATLARQLGATPHLYSLSARPRDVVMSVRDPRAPRDIDRHTWQDGVITGPEPDGVRDPDEPRWRTSTPGQVRLAAVPRRARLAESRPLEGGVTDDMCVSGGTAGPVIGAHRRGLRQRLVQYADARGRVREVQRLSP